MRCPRQDSNLRRTAEETTSFPLSYEVTRSRDPGWMGCVTRRARIGCGSSGASGCGRVPSRTVEVETWTEWASFLNLSAVFAQAGKGERIVVRRALHRLPVRIHAKPNFLIIGAQKAGTGSLYSWLTSRSDVLPARTKELHFFDQDPELSPIAGYWADFPLRLTLDVHRLIRQRPVITGEATPYYLFHPLVPQRVKVHVPEVKLIALLRDPVERAISQYWHEFNRGTERLPLEEALAAERDRIQPDLDRAARGQEPSRLLQNASYVARGRYAEQLARWTRLFDPSQLLVLQFEQLVTDPASVYERALTFLGLDLAASPAPRFQPKNVGSKQDTRQETLRWLREQFMEPNRELAAEVGIDYNATDEL